MELDKANLLVIVISFIFGSALFVITIIAGFIMGHYLFGIVGMPAYADSAAVAAKIKDLAGGKSVGEEIEVNIICPDDKETQVPVTIDLDDIQIQRNDNHSNQIKIDPKIMMEMKYPSLDQFIQNNFDFSDKNAMDQSFELIASCIDKIYTEEEVWASADCTKKEIKEFVESMNSTQFKDIEKFFETMPKLSHSITVTNPNTKVESVVVLEGLSSFFA